MKTTAELVDDLFKAHPRPDGREYTYREVSFALGGTVEPSHISKLRTGKITNPGRETLLALCRFFKVSPTYFFPELNELLPNETDERAQRERLHVALRSTGLSPEVQEKIEQLILSLQRAQE